MKILIVDDVPQMVELIRQTLLRAVALPKSSGEIREAHTVAQARLELLRHRPELIILDELLPGESPLDILQEPAFSEIPVILVSATASGTRPPIDAGGGRILARLPKWSWADLDRVASRIRELLPRKA